MGAPLVRRLLAAGFAVRVWNRTAAKLDALVGHGAQRAATVGDACDGADAVCVCLSNAQAVEQTLMGQHGVADARRAPRVVIDFSTIGPDATRQLGARLGDACGTAWIDAPVSGGPTGAASGKLVIFCGGPDALVAEVQPIFAAVSQRATHFGVTGNGQVAKVCNQVIVAVTLTAIAESVSLAASSGIDPAQLVESLIGGYADSIPLQIFGRRMARREFEPKLGELALMAKDLELAKQLGGSGADALPMVRAALEIYAAAAGRGLAHADLSTLITLRDAASRSTST